MKVEASWDSTVHECTQLSRAMAADQRIYLTVSAVVQLSHPAHMQLVLRKRICVSVVGRQVGRWAGLSAASGRLSFVPFGMARSSWSDLCLCGRALLRVC